MFVSHVSSFLFYLLSPPQYNARIVLLETRAFWRCPLCRGSTGKIGLCSGTLQNTVTIMAADGRNAHLTPHTRHCALCWCIRLMVQMGDDPLSNRMLFWGCWGGVWPSMHFFVPAMMHLCNIGVCWGPYTPSLKNISACLGGCCPSIKDDGVGRKALCAALGGNFCQRRLWSAIVVMVVVDQWHQNILIPMQH